MKNISTQELQKLKEQNLYRRLRVLENCEGTRATFEGWEILLFCGNDYLGMSRHPRVIAAAHKAIDRYGVGARSARLIAGTTDAHARLEKKLCHASLIDGAKLSGAEIRVFPHKNYEKCEEILKKCTARRKLLVTENVFGMDGDRADLKGLIRLKQKYGAVLIVDDAHGTGVFGKDDPGATASFSKGIDIIMGTLSKAIGGLGGFVAADRELIDHLINFARPFIFATALPPVLCEAAREAFCVIEEEPALQKKLWDNIAKVHQGLTGLGFSIAKPESAVLPVILGDEKEAMGAFEKLLAQGVFVPAVRYPTVPRGKARLRVTVSAAHTDEDIKQLLCAFKGLK
jgi:7-keto-8-aminopelargonate synthetase-like enzyme